MLARAFAPGESRLLEALLRDTAAEVHRIIDRDRRDRGLPAVVRTDARP